MNKTGYGQGECPSCHERDFEYIDNIEDEIGETSYWHCTNCGAEVSEHWERKLIYTHSTCKR